MLALVSIVTLIRVACDVWCVDPRGEISFPPVEVVENVVEESRCDRTGCRLEMAWRGAATAIVWKRPLRVYRGDHVRIMVRWYFSRHTQQWTGIAGEATLIDRLMPCVSLWPRCWHARSSRAFDRHCGDSGCGLWRAMALGDGSRLLPEQWTVLRDGGTLHVAVVSGLHFAAVAGLWLFVIRRRVQQSLATQDWSRLMGQVMPSIGLCLGYYALAGGGISSIRALCMTMLGAWLLLMRRRWHWSRSLAVTVCVVLSIAPQAIETMGFWLSFAAVAAILSMSTGRETSDEPTSWTTWGHLLVRVQWRVTLATIPVFVGFGQGMAVASPLVNLIVVPGTAVALLPAAAGMLAQSLVQHPWESMSWIAAALENGLFTVSAAAARGPQLPLWVMAHPAGTALAAVSCTWALFGNGRWRYVPLAAFGLCVMGMSASSLRAERSCTIAGDCRTSVQMFSGGYRAYATAFDHWQRTTQSCRISVGDDIAIDMAMMPEWPVVVDQAVTEEGLKWMRRCARFHPLVIADRDAGPSYALLAALRPKTVVLADRIRSAGRARLAWFERTGTTVNLPHWPPQWLVLRSDEFGSDPVYDDE